MGLGWRAIIGAIFISCCLPCLSPVGSASAQEPIPYTPEDLWLRSAIPVLNGYAEMFAQLNDVRIAMSRNYSDDETLRGETLYAVGIARERINMIHENNVWLLDIIGEPPPYRKSEKADLIRRIGDLKNHSSDIHLMNEAMLRNFEVAVTGSIVALDNGLLEAAALTRQLRSLLQHAEDYEAILNDDLHPVFAHKRKVTRATIDSLYLLSELDIIRGMSFEPPEYKEAMNQLVAHTKTMRQERTEVVRIIRSQLKYLDTTEEHVPASYKEYVKSMLEKEEIRADYIREVEMVIYHLSSTESSFEDVSRFITQAHRQYLRLYPKVRY